MKALTVVVVLVCITALGLAVWIAPRAANDAETPSTVEATHR